MWPTVAVEQTLGDRVRAIRIERNLSLEGLAPLLPLAHHFTWIGKVENDKIDLKLADVYSLATALEVSPGWLVNGDVEDTEFVTRLRAMEPKMDERGRREVLASAQRQVEEAALARKQADAYEEITRQMLAAGVDPETTRRVVQQARETAQASADASSAELPA